MMVCILPLSIRTASHHTTTAAVAFAPGNAGLYSKTTSRRRRSPTSMVLTVIGFGTSSTRAVSSDRLQHRQHRYQNQLSSCRRLACAASTNPFFSISNQQWVHHYCLQNGLFPPSLSSPSLLLYSTDSKLSIENNVNDGCNANDINNNVHASHGTDHGGNDDEEDDGADCCISLGYKKQSIIGYFLDEENHYVAKLQCGHNQHVRHNPPMIERPWVLTKTGRDNMLGYKLNCKLCCTTTSSASSSGGGTGTGTGNTA